MNIRSIVTAALLLALPLTTALADASEPATGNASQSGSAALAPPPTPDPDAGLLAAAHALKATRPELFGEADGVVVTEVLAGGQGAEAGLQPGDILLGYDATPLDSGKQVIELTRTHPKEAPVRLTYLRHEQVREAQIRGGPIGVRINDVEASPAVRMMSTYDSAARKAVNEGRFQEALEQSQRALAIAQAEQDKVGEAVFLEQIAVASRNLGRYSEALSHLEQSLAIFRELGERDGKGAAQINIAQVYLSLHRYKEALRYSEAALAIFRELKNRDREAACLSTIGDVYKELARYEEALKHHKEALAIARQIGDRAQE